MGLVLMKSDDKEHVTELEREQCEERFEDFLDSLHMCYIKHTGLLEEILPYKEYSIYLPLATKLQSPYIARFPRLKVFFSAQRNFHKKKDVGYIEIYRGQLERVAHNDISVGLFCCFSFEEQDFVIKPFSSIRGYVKALDSHMGKLDKRGGYWKKKVLLRWTPKITKKIKRIEEIDKEPTPSGYMKMRNCGYPERNPDGTLYHHIASLVTPEFSITHKDYFLITKEEFATYLKQHNNYPEGWKLKFKLIRNLLTKEF